MCTSGRKVNVVPVSNVHGMNRHRAQCTRTGRIATVVRPTDARHDASSTVACRQMSSVHTWVLCARTHTPTHLTMTACVLCVELLLTGRRLRRGYVRHGNTAAVRRLTTTRRRRLFIDTDSRRYVTAIHSQRHWSTWQVEYTDKIILLLLVRVHW